MFVWGTGEDTGAPVGRHSMTKNGMMRGQEPGMLGGAGKRRRGGALDGRSNHPQVF